MKRGKKEDEGDNQQQDSSTPAPDAQVDLQIADRWRRTGWKRRLVGDRPPEQVARRLARKLYVASETLLDRLFCYLSQLPDDTNSVEEDGNLHAMTPLQNSHATGLTLPASAIGWLASQIYNCNNTTQETSVRMTTTMNDSLLEDHRSTCSDVLSASVKDRLGLIKFLLPRLTHLRMVSEEWPRLKTKTKKKDEVSVNNTLEEEGVSAFLEYFDMLVHRPRVDLKLFPNLQVLLVECVPPEWIFNISSCEALQVLRVDKCYIYDLALFLENRENMEPAGDPLQPSIPPTGCCSNMMHLRLSHCQLDDISLGVQNSGPPQSILKNMRHLKSACLSHNEIARQRTVLLNLANKPFLSKVDLSYNQLKSLKHAHFRLGNIQTLILSHNRMRSVAGIDRLFSLETLWLDYNRLDDLTTIIGLARLPNLSSLKLVGNPLEVKRSRAYRVTVLDLFREQRLSMLPPNPSFRQLQSCLPCLDDQLATIGEMIALRDRTFTRAITGREVQDGFVVINVENETFPRAAAEGSPLPRKYTRRNANIDDMDSAERCFFPLQLQQETSSIRNNVAFNVVDVLESLVGSEQKEGEESNIESSHEQSAEADVVCTQDEPIIELDDWPSLEEAVHYELTKTTGKAKKSHVKKDESTELDQKLAPELIETHSIYSREIKSTDVFDSSFLGRSEPANIVNKMLSPIDDSKLESTNEQDADMSEEDEEELLTAPANKSQISLALDISSLSPIKADDYRNEGLKSSGSTSATTATDANLYTSKTAMISGGRPEKNIVREDSSRSAPDSCSTPTSINQSPGHLSLRVVSFTGNLWQEDSNSVQGSTGGLQREDASVQQNKFLVAEEKSTFEGANTFRDLSILENIDLYFRLFVFNYRQVDTERSQSPLTLGEDDDCRSVCEQYPKIQLWPIDRKLREALKEKSALAGRPESRESFRRVWKERIVACGKPALCRLTPNRGARYGFHGELLWSAASTSHIKPDTVAGCREVIACLSNSSFYIILDHDNVSARAKDATRKFPLPIPPDGRFKDAKWPHALARHPLAQLRGITIGFGFQRLTLRFANSTFPCPDEFTYVLLTSDKLKTVSLLKELQELTSEAKSMASGSAVATVLEAASVKIDNDDRRTLDALGVAVAPEAIGGVLHYQILQQTWKRGERGAVRRVCVVTDSKIFLLDEDYAGDGSDSVEAGGSRTLGESFYRLVDSADLNQIDNVKAADTDPNAITIAIRPSGVLQRMHNWRLLCRDRIGAERLVEDTRKAMSIFQA